MDPKVHKSRKEPKSTREQKQLKQQEDEQKNQLQRRMKRKAPEIDEEKKETKSTITQKERKGNEYKQSQAKSEAILNPNSVVMLARIKAKQLRMSKCATPNEGKAS